MKTKKILITTIIVLLFSCKEATLFDKPYPVIQTYDAEFNAKGIVLKGQFYSLGTDSVISYGFLVDSTDNNFKEGHIKKLEMGNKIELGEFKKEYISTSSIFFYCTYVETKNYKIKGNSKLVVSSIN